MAVSKTHRRMWVGCILAVSLLLVSAFLWHLCVLHFAHLQRKTVERIHDLGGIVYYEFMLDESFLPVDDEETPFLSSWLCRVLGEDYFYGVTMVVLVSDELTDADVMSLKHLSGLSHLCLYSDSVSDLGVDHLAEISTLESLLVEGDNVTESCILRLRDALPYCELNFRMVEERPKKDRGSTAKRGEE